jgi:hypothetical protein
MAEESTESGRVDLDDEKSTLLAFYTSFIRDGAQLPPKIVLFAEDKPIISVTARTYGDEADYIKCVNDLMYLVPALRPHLSLLSFRHYVHTTEGIRDSLVMVAFSATGALTEVFPIINNNGAISYDLDSKIDPNADSVYSEQIAHMLPIFVRIDRSPFSATDIIDFLEFSGNTVEYAEEFARNTINLRAGV